jgi:hypothetical protein
MTPVLLGALRRRRRPRRLVDCDHCGRDCVNPVAWLEHDEDRWWVRVRCGHCQRIRELVIDNEQARQFDADLDRGVNEIARRLSRLSRDGSRWKLPGTGRAAASRSARRKRSRRARAN